MERDMAKRLAEFEGWEREGNGDLIKAGVVQILDATARELLTVPPGYAEKEGDSLNACAQISSLRREAKTA